MRDIYHDTDNMQFNNIFCIYHPGIVIPDNYLSFLSFYISNYIVFVIAVENINHLFVNEFILFVLSKYQFLHFHIIVRIKCIHHYLILNGFYNILVTETSGTGFPLIIVSVTRIFIITSRTRVYCCINHHSTCH